MRFPVLRGTIDRRILLNYRVDPEVLCRCLPSPFRPQVVGGYGIAGICLIRLRGVRPVGWAESFGLTSENAAHRIAVEWDGSDSLCRGVFVPRRDTSLWINTLVGGRFFPGVHHFSRFDVCESGGACHVEFTHADGTHVSVDASDSNEMPAGSVFGSLAEATAFFSAGSLGYSPTPKAGCFDGLELRALNWNLTPLAIDRVASTFFDDRRIFPCGSVVFDSAFLVRDIEHEWHAAQSLCGGEGHAAKPNDRQRATRCATSRATIAEN